MGRVPIEVVDQLAAVHGIRRAVETGTFRGAGTRLLADRFEEVETIELSRRYAWRARGIFATRRNGRVRQGDSRHLLQPSNTPTLYWLDGHSSGGATAGKANECPLIEELRATSPGHAHDCYLIDDARMFLGPPPPPHHREEWPTYDEIVALFRELRPGHAVRVEDDVIVAVPRNE